MIAIIDCGMGNLRSVQKGLEKVGFAARVVDDPGSVAAADGVILPGVGAFARAMAGLAARGYDRAIRAVVADGRPLLGICLGQQLLFESSEEWGMHRGLGLLRGVVRRFPPGRKVPHMGWNEVEIVRPSPLMAGIPDRTRFYFVHSFYVDPAVDDLVLGRAAYGVDFAAVTGRDRIWGIQFHPEKSSNWGLKILANFGRMVEDARYTGDRPA